MDLTWDKPSLKKWYEAVGNRADIKVERMARALAACGGEDA